MITTRRSNGFATESNTARGGVDLLERKSASYEPVAPLHEENPDEARARMQRNLDRLLNYDRYSELEDTVEQVADEAVEETKAMSDEDINPTSTTTQFINGDPQIFNDAEKSKERKTSYKLNGKGKLVVVLYALVVTVILALIVLNTGVLKSLSGEIASLDASYQAKVTALAAQQATINEISADSHVIEIAENEFGMVAGN